MKYLVPMAIVTSLLFFYAFYGREWLKSKEWTAPFFTWIEPIEITLFSKSRTILFARMKMVTGAVLTLLTQMGAIDLTPIMPFVSEAYQGIVKVALNCVPLIITVMGWMDESLRKVTTTPLEIVAVPEANTSPEVVAAIATAEKAKEVAVEKVKEAS